MSTRTLKYLLSVAALMAVAGITAPATADQMYVSVNSTDGVFNDPNATISGSPVYFGGIIQYQDLTTNVLYNVFCDDPGNDVGVGGTYQYQLEDETYANKFLAPLGSLDIIHEIAGLTAYGLANPTNASLDEYVQEAIWHLMSANITLNGATLTGVTNLLGLGESHWDSYWNALAAKGWSYGQLVDPEGCGETGQITYQDCQTQGQMYLYRSVPEPGTVGLLGVGLVGLAGATWRRRKSANRSAA